MNQEVFYKRVAPLLNTPMLRTRRVVVIGVGSGGCRVAAEMGRLGVRLLLVDRPGERVEEHNIVRHLLGYQSLGKSKVAEMARYIQNLNPASHITPCALDVVQEEARLGRLLGRWRPNLVAVCTDNEASKHAINRVALQLRMPQIGGAVYDGGIGGEIYRVRPGQACYGCIADHLQLRPLHTEIPGSIDYSNPAAAEAPSTCALNLDIEQIALIQCRLALGELLDPTTDFTGLPSKINLCVFANRVVPGVFSRPLHTEFFHVPRRKDCLECGETQGNVEAEADRILSALRPGT